jgi:NADH dehydrogenase (ubiquinone) 1 alpha subcomplex subunit 12
VIYNNLDWYTGQDAASIAPEWHGWLHHITDANPVTAPSAYAPPLYAVPKKGLTPPGVPRYAPKGAWANPAQRSWVKVQAWKPPGAV